MKKPLLLLGIWLAAQSAGAWGQTEPPVEERGQDRLLQMLFPPDLVMRNQQELGLTADQREYILDQIRQAQNSFTEHQWDLQREMETLTGMVSSGQAAEAEMTAQLDKILDLERSIKRTRFLLALRIRQALQPDQLSKLDELRPQRRLREARPLLPRRP